MRFYLSLQSTSRIIRFAILCAAFCVGPPTQAESFHVADSSGHDIFFVGSSKYESKGDGVPVEDYSLETPMDDPLLDLGETGAAFLGPTLSLADSQVGYIDSAIVGTNIRFRFDAAYDFDEPDRAEFFYSTWTTFGGETDPATIGPNDSVDNQAFSLYYEQALGCRFSLFVQAAALLNSPSGVPGPGPNTQGFGDMIAGAKFVAWQRCNQQLTFQLKNYIPTGEANKWLTAGHYSIEPGILYFNRLNRRWTLEAELRDWIPIGGADGPAGGPREPYAGNVLRYGAGLSYNWIDNCSLTVRPVVEVVGWSVLDGQKFAFPANAPVDADGDQIINLKIGTRISRAAGWGGLYIGYGTALTDEAWYNDILRVDYRFVF